MDIHTAWHQLMQHFEKKLIGCTETWAFQYQQAHKHIHLKRLTSECVTWAPNFSKVYIWHTRPDLQHALAPNSNILQKYFPLRA